MNFVKKVQKGVTQVPGSIHRTQILGKENKCLENVQQKNLEVLWTVDRSYKDLSINTFSYGSVFSWSSKLQALC